VLILFPELAWMHISTTRKDMDGDTILSKKKFNVTEVKLAPKLLPVSGSGITACHVYR